MEIKKKLSCLAEDLLRRHNEILGEVEDLVPMARRERAIMNYEELETGFPREEETQSEGELWVLRREDERLEDSFLTVSEVLRFARTLEGLEEGKGTVCRANVKGPGEPPLRAVRIGGKYILLYTEDEANVSSVCTVDEAVYMACRLFLPEETADWPLPVHGEVVTA